jgi:hypothetical protein
MQAFTYKEKTLQYLKGFLQVYLTKKDEGVNKNNDTNDCPENS